MPRTGLFTVVLRARPCGLPETDRTCRASSGCLRRPGRALPEYSGRRTPRPCRRSAVGRPEAGPYGVRRGDRKAGGSSSYGSYEGASDNTASHEVSPGRAKPRAWGCGRRRTAGGSSTTGPGTVGAPLHGAGSCLARGPSRRSGVGASRPARLARWGDQRSVPCRVVGGGSVLRGYAALTGSPHSARAGDPAVLSRGFGSQGRGICVARPRPGWIRPTAHRPARCRENSGYPRTWTSACVPLVRHAAPERSRVSEVA